MFKYALVSLSFSLVTLIGLTTCQNKESKIEEIKISKGLKDIYEDHFYIGAAINANQISMKDSNAVELLPKEFNSISPENVMKCEIIHPEWDKYNFEFSDKFVELAKKNNFHSVGHTLIWHSQLSPFVNRIKDKDSLRTFMENHINTVAGRYDGKLNGWDVVNEALEEDGSLRKSIFQKILGDEYIVEAFKLAQKASPKSELYYNDYNIEQPKKRAGAIALIKKIKAAGVRIDGVGIQGHWSIKGIPLEDLEQSIKEYSALGIKVMLTELDITTLPNPWDLKGADVNQNFAGSPFMNPYPNRLPDSMQIKLAVEYENLFKLLVKYKDNISRVTFWGVSDGNSWLNGWPIKNRTNYPLLFDRNYRPKLAYEKVIGVLKKA